MTNDQEDQMITALSRIAMELETISVLFRIGIVFMAIGIVILAVTRI